MKLFITLAVLVFSNAISAQDVLRALRDDASGYAEVIKGYVFDFPRDHLAHPEFRTEWWYLTANLTDQQGQQWGLQWTLFRQALTPAADQQGWQNNQLWMAHAAITTPQGHFYEQRFARGGIGQAGVQRTRDADYFNAWLDDWEWSSNSASLFPAGLNFSVGERQIRLKLIDTGKRVLHGDKGYSQKSAQGQASYYYSHPHIQVEAELDNGDDKVSLTGNAWLDREWSSQPLAPNQSGWDWFSLHLNSGEKLMVYRLRHDDGEHWLSGSWIDATGHSIALHRDDIRMNLIASRKVEINTGQVRKLPLEWTIELPGKTGLLSVKPLYDAQWMGTGVPYWEGVVLVEEIGVETGVGYMELTGYN